MSKDIVFITNTMSRGGAARVISILANHYAKKGWKVGLILRKVENPYPLDETIKIIEVGDDTQTSRFKWIRIIRDYVKQRKGCTVVSFLSMVNVFTIIATRGLDAKVIVSERNDIKVANAGIKFYLAKFMYGQADHIVFQSKRVKNYFSKKVQDKSTIILNPISVSCYASDMAQKKIVNSGRLAPQKNQKMLISAFARLKKELPEYILYIYGEGTLRKNLEDQIENLRLGDCIYLPGNVSDIHEQISDAQMFVLSSDFEGLSNSLLESMMMGIPCISTECAGSDETIRNEENGILIPIGDEDRLYEAMKQLAINDVLRERIIANARKDSEAFKYENVIRNWEKVFEE